jgi:hypothetical protein
MHDPPLQTFRGRRILVAAGALGLLALGHVIAPYADSGPVLCPLHGLLGLPCPGCGMTRALSALLQLELDSALRHHGLSPLLLLALSVTPFACVYEAWRREPTFSRPLGVLCRSRLAAGALLALLSVHHGLRLIAWRQDGTLREYAETSWTSSALRALARER